MTDLESIELDLVPSAADDDTTITTPSPLILGGGEDEEATAEAEVSEVSEDEANEVVVVDLENKDMDPMEWSVRKVLPIPAKYYWQTGGTGLNLPLKTRLWHRSVYTLGRCLYYCEYVGEVLAHTLGIEESSYQYVMDGMSEEDWEKAKKVNEVRTKEWKDFKAKKDEEEKAEVAEGSLSVEKGVEGKSEGGSSVDTEVETI